MEPLRPDLQPHARLPAEGLEHYSDFLRWLSLEHPRPPPEHPQATRYRWGQRARAFDAMQTAAVIPVADLLSNTREATIRLVSREINKLLLRSQTDDGPTLDPIRVRDFAVLAFRLEGLEKLFTGSTGEERDLSHLTDEQFAQIAEWLDIAEGAMSRGKG